MMINDPQGYAEKVFGALKRSNHSFEVKIGMMNLISRLVTANKLMIHNFYSFLQKYTQPHQQHITQLLAILAQSIHPLVSPEVVEPIIMHIANTFVADRRPNEVIAIGINTIREICLRSPLVMNETLLKDIVQYKRSKDKGIVMATKSIIAVIRAINPQILPRKERGKDTDLEIKPSQFGEEQIMDGIEDTEYINQLSDKSDIESESESKSNQNSWETVSEDEDKSTHQKENEKSEKMEDEDLESHSNATEEQHSTKSVEPEELEDESDHEDEKVEFTEGDVQSDGEKEKNSNEGEQEEEKSEVSQPPGLRLEAVKILSDEDWAKIRYIREHKKELQKKGVIPTTKKRKMEAVDEDVDVDSIVGYKKKRRMTKQDREKVSKESQKEKAQDQKQYGYGKKIKGASTTNIEKRKSKPYAMLRQKAMQNQRSRSANQNLRRKEKHIQKLASQKLDHH